MKMVQILLVCVIGLVFLTFLIRSRIAPSYRVTADDIPQVIRQLQHSGKNGNFAVLMFVPPGSSDGEAVNLQYSIEDGAVGLDWVLISPRNIADQAKVTEFADQRGYWLEKLEMNGVRYLRYAGSNMDELGIKIVREFYGIGPDMKIEMITEGFQWQAR